MSESGAIAVEKNVDSKEIANSNLAPENTPPSCSESTTPSESLQLQVDPSKKEFEDAIFLTKASFNPKLVANQLAVKALCSKHLPQDSERFKHIFRRANVPKTLGGLITVGEVVDIYSYKSRYRIGDRLLFLPKSQVPISEYFITSEDQAIKLLNDADYLESTELVPILKTYLNLKNYGLFEKKEAPKPKLVTNHAFSSFGFYLNSLCKYFNFDLTNVVMGEDTNEYTSEYKQKFPDSKFMFHDEIIDDSQKAGEFDIAFHIHRSTKSTAKFLSLMKPKTQLTTLFNQRSRFRESTMIKRPDITFTKFDSSAELPFHDQNFIKDSITIQQLIRENKLVTMEYEYIPLSNFRPILSSFQKKAFFQRQIIKF